MLYTLVYTNPSTSINKEWPMSRLIRRLAALAARGHHENTTFCESCGRVCTSECRSRAVLERRRDEAQRAALFRV